MIFLVFFFSVLLRIIFHNIAAVSFRNLHCKLLLQAANFQECVTQWYLNLIILKRLYKKYLVMGLGENLLELKRLCVVEIEI